MAIAADTGTSMDMEHEADKHDADKHEITDAAWSRRGFLRFTGRSVSSLAVWTALGSLADCFRPGDAGSTRDNPGFKPIEPSRADEVGLVEGLRARVLIAEGDPINGRGDRFGKNNDFIAFIPETGLAGTKPTGSKREALLWVNHEYPIPLFTKTEVLRRATNRRQAETMRKSVGASILKIRQSLEGHWSFAQDKSNRRLDGRTPFELASPRPINGKRTVRGTMGNCSGGTTPWGTVLTCEENTFYYYGYNRYRRGEKELVIPSYGFQWQEFFKGDPEHYGWVVEVDPRTGRGRKLTALGRFSHESATFALSKDGRAIVYMGEDKRGGCIYKFISDRPGRLDEGVLYVADMSAGRWEPLVISRPELKTRFRDQLDILVRAPEAAALVGGTPLDRPEDIEVDPASGGILAALTNNRREKNYYGSILRLEEKGGDHGAREFTHRTFLSGGHGSGFACPDNMVFDPRGNLWVTSDISERRMHKKEYRGFGNNGLFYIPMSGPAAGGVFQAASAPRDAEFTGPCFSADGRTLFLSVQHPGIGSKKRNRLTSHWPDGGMEVPRSAVIALTGPVLEKLTGI